MLRYRFNKDCRLTHSSEFQAVFADTQLRLSRGPFLVLALANSTGRARLGLVMRRKNLRLASQRNLMKRLVRENFRLRQHQLPHLDLIFMSRSGIEGKRRPDLNQDICWLLDKIAGASA